MLTLKDKYNDKMRKQSTKPPWPQDTMVLAHVPTTTAAPAPAPPPAQSLPPGHHTLQITDHLSGPLP